MFELTLQLPDSQAEFNVENPDGLKDDSNF